MESCGMSESEPVYLKPIYSATIDQWREHSQAISERISNRTHGQNNM